MIKEAIEKVGKRIDLSEDEMRGAFGEIMSGRAADSEIIALLDGLRKKGETVGEITAAARVLREKSLRLELGGEKVLDTCGTGGTGINTFNISTTAAFVVAGCGIKVAKHGNRSASSQCGSADVLESLGVKIDIQPELVTKCIKEISIGFIFAPLFHTAMKYAAVPRKELGGKTIFNILGPLSNPANAAYQIVGVYDEKLTEVLAGVLKNLGLKRGMVLAGGDGLDEITIASYTKITELNNGTLKTYKVTPEDFGIGRASIEDLRGGDAEDNARMVLTVLNGEKSPRRDVVLMNASAALVSSFRAKDFKDGVRLAEESIDSRAALDKLTKLVEVTNK